MKYCSSFCYTVTNCKFLVNLAENLGDSKSFQTPYVYTVYFILSAFTTTGESIRYTLYKFLSTSTCSIKQLGFPIMYYLLPIDSLTSL